jgi:hypothetical protein
VVKNLSHKSWTQASKPVQRWWGKVRGYSQIPALKFVAAFAPDPAEAEKEQWDCFVQMVRGESKFNALVRSPHWTCNICGEKWQTDSVCSNRFCGRPRGAESQFAQLERHRELWWTKRNEKDRQAEKILYSLLDTSPLVNVAPGTERPKEGVQLITVSSAAADLDGTFTLSFMGKPNSVDIKHDASESDVHFAIEGLTTNPTFSVSVKELNQSTTAPISRHGKVWHVTFTSMTGDLPLMLVQTTAGPFFDTVARGGSLLGTRSEVVVEVTGDWTFDPAKAFNELYAAAAATGKSVPKQGVQLITVSSAAADLAGTFTLSFMGKPNSVDIKHDASETEVHLAIEGLSAMPTFLSVSVKELNQSTTAPISRHGKVWHVTFTSMISMTGDLPLMLVQTTAGPFFDTVARGGSLLGTRSEVVVKVITGDWTSDPAKAFNELYAAAATGKFVPKVQELLKARADNNCQQVMLCEASPLLASMFKPRPQLPDYPGYWCGSLRDSVLETTTPVSRVGQVACSLVDYVLKPNDKQSQRWLYFHFACPMMGLGQAEVKAVIHTSKPVHFADSKKALVVHSVPAQKRTIYFQMMQGVVEHDLRGLLDAVEPLITELAPALCDDPMALEVLLVWLKGLSNFAEKLKARKLSDVWDDSSLQALLGQMMEGLLQLGRVPSKEATGHVPVEKLNALVTCTLAMATNRIPKLVEAGSLLFAGQLKPQQLGHLQQLLAFFGPIIAKSGQANVGGQDGQGVDLSEDGLKMILKQLIAKVDTNGNGEISYDEFADLLQMLQLPLPENSQKLLFAKVDIDGGGEIGEEEFMFATDLLVDELCEQTMAALHLSETDLLKLLVFVGSLLATFFLFLYFGIESFTSGSTFSAVINSAIAATGGGAATAAGEEESDSDDNEDLRFSSPVGFAVKDALSAATAAGGGGL